MARNNYIFVDFENVQETDLDRIVGKPVMVTLVLGPNHKTLPVSLVKKLLKCAPQVQLIETKIARKNAADFVLSERIGEQKQSDPDGYFHIVSNDRGFEALIEHLREPKGFAALRSSFRDIPVLMNTAERVQSLSAFFKAHPVNRPGTIKKLESQIQANFGKALSADEVADTIKSLVAKKVLCLAENGDVEY